MPAIKVSGLRSCRADANCVGLASKSSIVNINIVAARGQVLTGCKAHRDVVVASCIGLKRSGGGGRIVRASCVAKERSRTVGCIIDTDVIAKKRLKPFCRVETARCVAVLSAPLPLAAFLKPVVLLNRAFLPACSVEVRRLCC